MGMLSPPCFIPACLPQICLHSCPVLAGKSVSQLSGYNSHSDLLMKH